MDNYKMNIFKQFAEKLLDRENWCEGVMNYGNQDCRFYLLDTDFRVFYGVDSSVGVNHDGTVQDDYLDRLELSHGYRTNAKWINISLWHKDLCVKKLQGFSLNNGRFHMAEPFYDFNTKENKGYYVYYKDIGEKGLPNYVTAMLNFGGMPDKHSISYKDSSTVDNNVGL